MPPTTFVFLMSVDCSRECFFLFDDTWKHKSLACLNVVSILKTFYLCFFFWHLVCFNFTRVLHACARFYQKYQELRARIKANSCPVLLPAQPITHGHMGQTGSTASSGGPGGVPGVVQVNHYSATGLGSIGSTNNTYSVQRSTSLKDHRQLR